MSNNYIFGWIGEAADISKEAKKEDLMRGRIMIPGKLRGHLEMTLARVGRKGKEKSSFQAGGRGVGRGVDGNRDKKILILSKKP